MTIHSQPHRKNHYPQLNHYSPQKKDSIPDVLVTGPDDDEEELIDSDCAVTDDDNRSAAASAAATEDAAAAVTAAAASDDDDLKDIEDYDYNVGLVKFGDSKCNQMLSV